MKIAGKRDMIAAIIIAIALMQLSCNTDEKKVADEDGKQYRKMRRNEECHTGRCIDYKLAGDHPTFSIFYFEDRSVFWTRGLTYTYPFTGDSITVCKNGNIEFHKEGK